MWVSGCAGSGAREPCVVQGPVSPMRASAQRQCAVLMMNAQPPAASGPRRYGVSPPLFLSVGSDLIKLLGGSLQRFLLLRPLSGGGLRFLCSQKPGWFHGTLKPHMSLKLSQLDLWETSRVLSHPVDAPAFVFWIPLPPPCSAVPTGWGALPTAGSYQRPRSRWGHRGSPPTGLLPRGPPRRSSLCRDVRQRGPGSARGAP